MIAVGIDVGSISAKAALVEDGRLIATIVKLTGYNSKRLAQLAEDTMSH